MPITEYLVRNRKEYGNEVALVDVNPEQKDTQRITWKDYSLIQPTEKRFYKPLREHGAGPRCSQG